MNPCLTHEQTADLSRTIHEALPPDVGFVILVFPEHVPVEGGVRTVGMAASVDLPESLRILCKFAEKAKKMMPLKNETE